MLTHGRQRGCDGGQRRRHSITTDGAHHDRPCLPRRHRAPLRRHAPATMVTTTTDRGRRRSSTPTRDVQTADTQSRRSRDDNDPLTYDNELLDAHFVTGDGRGNENIGLTAVHTIFHSEHNRLVEANKETILAIAATWPSSTNGWPCDDRRPTCRRSPARASPRSSGMASACSRPASFVTEMQYQHLVFEEFARKIQPNIDPVRLHQHRRHRPVDRRRVRPCGLSLRPLDADRHDRSARQRPDAVDGDTEQSTLIEASSTRRRSSASGADARRGRRRASSAA